MVEGFGLRVRVRFWVKVRVSFGIIAMEIVVVHSIKMNTVISGALSFSKGIPTGILCD